jgi:hypothetical protein
VKDSNGRNLGFKADVWTYGPSHCRLCGKSDGLLVGFDKPVGVFGKRVLGILVAHYECLIARTEGGDYHYEPVGEATE